MSTQTASSNVLVEIYASSNDKKLLRLGITKCIEEVMDDSSAAVLFLDALLGKPKELFFDVDFLKDVGFLIQTACKRHLTQDNALFDDCASKLLAFLLHIVNIPGQDTPQPVYDFTKNNFLHIMEHFDKAGSKTPSNQTTLQSLLTALTLIGSLNRDWTPFYRYSKISKRYAVEYSKQMQALAESQLNQLPIGKDPSQQEDSFKLLIDLFPFYREAAPQQLMVCLTRLEKCTLTEKMLPLLFRILHLAHDTAACPAKYLRQIFIRNIYAAFTLPLRGHCQEIVSLFEKLNTMRSPTEGDEVASIVKMYIGFVRHLFFATLSRASHENSEGEGLIDRYLQKVILPFRSQVVAQNKKTLLEQLALIQAHIKSLGLLLIFMPHWARLYLRVENEILKKQQLSLSKLLFKEQLLQIERHQRFLPDELKAIPEELLRDISILGLAIVSGLKIEEIQELQHKANSVRLLNWSLRTLKVYFECRVHIANMEQNAMSIKVVAHKAVQSEFQQIFATIEKAFESLFKADKSLQKTLTSCKEITGIFRGKKKS